MQVTAEVASERAIRALQMTLLSAPVRPLEPIELENVSPALLLPPSGGPISSALAGGVFELGDRVACMQGAGTPPLGLRGTIVGTPTTLDPRPYSYIVRESPHVHPKHDDVANWRLAGTESTTTGSAWNAPALNAHCAEGIANYQGMK